MSPTTIEIIIGDPTSECPLKESRSFWGTPSLSTNIYKYSVVLSTISSSKNISVTPILRITLHDFLTEILINEDVLK